MVTQLFVALKMAALTGLRQPIQPPVFFATTGNTTAHRCPLSNIMAASGGPWNGEFRLRAGELPTAPACSQCAWKPICLIPEVGLSAISYPAILNGWKHALADGWRVTLSSLRRIDW